MKRPTLLLFLLSTSLVASSQNSIPGNAINSSKHYRESGVGNATGRAGAANMTARALLGKDGNTTVEVTTGTLDSGKTPPGSFAKVQFKPLNLAGDALFAQNFTPLSTAGGYYSFVWPSLHRAQQIQLQGNIDGIDKNRTDVVTVVETTKLRPDLSVQRLDFLSSEAIYHPVNISANIVELNGDASAITTCVLAIDGSNVDQAANVYVDAGGSVSCAFVYTFSSTGSHTIQVTATNVVPGDWDTSNNSASGTITITNPYTAEHAGGWFYDINGSFPLINLNSFEYWYRGNVQENYSDTSGTAGHEQASLAVFISSGCAGSTNAVPWQFPVNVAYTESMDTTSVYSLTDTGVNGYTTPYSGNFTICNSTVTSFTEQYGSDFVNDHWNYLYAGQYYDSASNLVYSYQEINISRMAGDVSYFSYGYQCFYWNSPSGTCNSPSDYYTWNSSGKNVYGTIIPVGSTWIPNVATQDAAGNTFSGAVSIPLSRNRYTNYQPIACYNYGSDSYGYAYQNCSQYNFDFTITQGLVLAVH
ncbi:MAG: hypothetical protein DMG98_18720 [Acidobacteria bacterium]|nr:MAG: hypothetical protein DMG98_18720 [Acidobacteriota bacterium]